MDLRSSNKQVALEYLPIYDTQKNIIQQCKDNEFQIIGPTWNDEFELPDGFYLVSDIQDYLEYILQKQET